MGSRSDSPRGRGARLLLLFGPTGVGKTHLLRTEVARVRDRDPQAVVVLTTGRELLDDVLATLRGDTSRDPWRRWPLPDLVVIDDLHVVADRPVTQREIARRIEELVKAGVRVLCAAGCREADLPALTAALRMVAGAHLVELGRPSRGEIVQILRGQAVADGPQPGARTLARIARSSAGDVRRALGALTRIRFQERYAMRASPSS